MDHPVTPFALPAQPPVVLGALGSAWLYDSEAIAALDPERIAAAPVSLLCYAVHAPYAHPFWSCYWVGACALRDTPGVPPAVVYLPSATHEIIVYAMDPDHPIDLKTHPYLLHPVNFAGQFIEASDEAANARVRQAVQDIVDGTLNPDTDNRNQWVMRFSGSNILQSHAEH